MYLFSVYQVWLKYIIFHLHLLGLFFFFICYLFSKSVFVVVVFPQLNKIETDLYIFSLFLNSFVYMLLLFIMHNFFQKIKYCLN